MRQDPEQVDRLAEAGRVVLAIVGAGLVGVGGFLHYAPLGFAAAGAMLFSVALIGALRSR